MPAMCRNGASICVLISWWRERARPVGIPLICDARPAVNKGLAMMRRLRICAVMLAAVWVAPVMVIWADFPQRVVDENQCVYVHGDELVSWLRGREQRIAPSRMQTIVEAVTAAWTSDRSASQGHDG